METTKTHCPAHGVDWDSECVTCHRKMMAAAKVGMAALIDEATGYQEKRPWNALRKLHRELTCTGESES